MMEDIWNNNPSAYITSFWGWRPEEWGGVGFTKEGRRDTIKRETTDPFVMFIYVTKGAKTLDKNLKGYIAGFYLVSHIEGHRTEFNHPRYLEQEPNNWQYCLKAIRAFNFLPEYRLHIDDLDPSIKDRAQAVGQWGEELSADKLKRLQEIPCVEVPVYAGNGHVDGNIYVPNKRGHKVRDGNANRTGYYVEGEPYDTEKELYALIMRGDTEAFLGRPALGKEIYKIGLSMSPCTRLNAFNKALPEGAFQWELHRTTREDGNAIYPCYEAAESGENAMKDHLGMNSHAEWLGGEFYLASDDDFKEAWLKGREVAVKYKKDE